MGNVLLTASNCTSNFTVQNTIVPYDLHDGLILNDKLVEVQISPVKKQTNRRKMSLLANRNKETNENSEENNENNNNNSEETTTNNNNITSAIPYYQLVLEKRRQRRKTVEKKEENNKDQQQQSLLLNVQSNTTLNLDISSPPPKLVEWLELKDKETKAIYYHNKHTGVSVWKKPQGFDEAITVKETNSYWIAVHDSKGRKYYYDLLSKETRWDKPATYTDAIEDV